MTDAQPSTHPFHLQHQLASATGKVYVLLQMARVEDFIEIGLSAEHADQLVSFGLDVASHALQSKTRKVKNNSVTSFHQTESPSPSNALQLNRLQNLPLFNLSLLKAYNNHVQHAVSMIRYSTDSRKEYKRRRLNSRRHEKNTHERTNANKHPPVKTLIKKTFSKRLAVAPCLFFGSRTITSLSEVVTNNQPCTQSSRRTDPTQNPTI